MSALLHTARLAWWRWAARELCPLHPDYPFVILRLNELERL
jgi:hypothetical protein